MEFTLTLGGNLLIGWKSFSIDTSITEPVSTASVGFKDFTPNRFNEANQLLEIRHGKTILFKGYTFGVSKNTDIGTLSFSLEARNLFADLYDSSIGYEPLFKTKSYLSLLSSVCRKFKATNNFIFNIENNLPIDKTELEKALPEEGIWSYISDLSKKRQILPFVLPDNTLKVTDNIYSLGRRTSIATYFDSVDNNVVKYCSASVKKEDLFNVYGYVSEVSAQSVRSKQPTYKKGAVRDFSVRPERISYENIRIEKDKSLADRKIKWRKAIATASQQSLNITTNKLYNQDGNLWQIGDYIDYTNDYLGISGVFLITNVQYQFSSESGTTCTITLADPKALLPEPPDALSKSQQNRETMQNSRVSRRKKKTQKETQATPYGKVPLDDLLGEPK